MDAPLGLFFMGVALYLLPEETCIDCTGLRQQQQQQRQQRQQRRLDNGKLLNKNPSADGVHKRASVRGATVSAEEALECDFAQPRPGSIATEESSLNARGYPNP